jgi:hypothetical protein
VTAFRLRVLAGGTDRAPRGAPDPLFLPAAAALTDDGVTPEHAWRWDPHWADPDLRDAAVLNLAEALASFQGVPSPLEAHQAEMRARAPRLAASNPDPEPCALPPACLRAIPEAEPEMEAEP